jgi:hypothetical protein
MRFRKYYLIPIAVSIGAALLVGLTETRYYLDLNRIAGIKLLDMPNTIGQYWAEGKMPVQYDNYEIINLGHTSCNPFDYESPSINFWHNSMGMPTIVSFSTRDMLPEETNVIKSFNNGDFTGIKEYAVILGLDTLFVAGKYLLDRRVARKMVRNNKIIIAHTHYTSMRNFYGVPEICIH